MLSYLHSSRLSLVLPHQAHLLGLCSDSSSIHQLHFCKAIVVDRGITVVQ